MNFWLHSPRHSLSSKLVMLFLVMALVFLFLVGGSLHHSFRQHFEKNVRPHIAQYLQYVREDIGTPPNYLQAKALADSLNIEINIVDERGTWSSHQREFSLQALNIHHRHREGNTRYAMGEIDDREYLVMYMDKATLLFNIPEIRQGRGLKSFFPLALLCLVLFFLYHIIRRLFAPILTIQNGVKRMGAGELSHRIHIKRSDELGVLARDINHMAEDIQNILDAKRHLLLAISHELRSPLTRAKVATELLENQPNKAQIQRDLASMQTLIDEILETEKLSTPHQALNKTQADIRTVFEKIQDTYFKDKALQFNFPTIPVIAEIDTARIKLLLKNLIDNALRYNKEGKPVVVHLQQQTQNIEIQIIDCGPGIDEEHIPHLMEPFYRVDPARQRETGGYGLGLYLCRRIAEAHYGSLEINSIKGSGTTVNVFLPKKFEHSISQSGI